MLEPEAGISRKPATLACLARTRSAVLNVLVVVGAGIAASGWILGRHNPDAALPWGLERTQRALMGALMVLGVASYVLLRVGSGRDALRDPSRRAANFFKARVGTASIAGLAIPLGFAYGWLIDPRLQALAPFWIAALGLGFLALPRGAELDDFDEPMIEA
ncbi:hypothetical protein P12x_005747 [Tundrisphaera lichenicola]|uniref:hypothetical protein n=1 Tax=Tundrisphaera lichenicola TaxID=2029860 RepID=UPI003EB787C1